MPLKHSNSKGKAVVKEEVFPLPPVEQKPFALMISNDPQEDDKSMVKKEAEVVSLPILETAAAPPGYHQTPPSNNNNTVSGIDGNNNNNNNAVLGGLVGSSSRSSVQQDPYDVGSSSTTSAAQIMQLAALQWGAIAVPTLILPAFHQVDPNRRVLLKDVLQHCVAALAAGDVVAADAALVTMSSSHLASPDGDPLQRVAYTFAEALARRALQLLPGVSRGLLQLELPRQHSAAAGYTCATRLRFDAVCPLLRVAAAVANHAIVTATEGEEHVHVVDLGGASPNQWLELLHLFAAERRSLSSLRLTVVSEDDGLLAAAAWLLHQEAARLGIPFVFSPVRSHIDRLSPGDVVAACLGPHPHEALAITSTLQLHRLIADTIELPLPAAGSSAAADGRKAAKKAKHHQNHMVTRVDVLLRVLYGLSPKVMLLTEQEGYHNGATLGERVGNALDYYAALFEDLEPGGDSADRAAVERVLLREEIMDIVTRDGEARRERHEGVMRWAQRMGGAGFRPMIIPGIRRFDAFADPALLALQLSFHATLRYWVAQDNTFFVIFANMTPIFSVTAWKPETSTTGQQ